MKNVGKFAYIPNVINGVSSVMLTETWLDTTKITGLRIEPSVIDNKGVLLPRRLVIFLNEFESAKVLYSSNDDLEKILDNIANAMDWERDKK